MCEGARNGGEKKVSNRSDDGTSKCTRNRKDTYLDDRYSVVSKSIIEFVPLGDVIRARRVGRWEACASEENARDEENLAVHDVSCGMNDMEMMRVVEIIECNARSVGSVGTSSVILFDECIRSRPSHNSVPPFRTPQIEITDGDAGVDVGEGGAGSDCHQCCP